MQKIIQNHKTHKCPHQPAHSDTADRQCLGTIGESAVAKMLENNGQKILARNWRCAFGELDIIALDSEHLVAVEVKTRRQTGYGDPLTAITPEKLLRIEKLLKIWQAQKPAYRNKLLRVDAAGVLANDTAYYIDYLQGVQHG